MFPNLLLSFQARSNLYRLLCPSILLPNLNVGLSLAESLNFLAKLLLFNPQDDRHGKAASTSGSGPLSSPSTQSYLPPPPPPPPVRSPTYEDKSVQLLVQPQVITLQPPRTLSTQSDDLNEVRQIQYTLHMSHFTICTWKTVELQPSGFELNFHFYYPNFYSCL